MYSVVIRIRERTSCLLLNVVYQFIISYRDKLLLDSVPVILAMRKHTKSEIE